MKGLEMKIIRLKRGYSIRLTDAEMSLLRSFVSEGIEGICTDGTFENQGIGKAEERAWNQRTEHGHFLRVDEDRRP
jgi:hypothetical protein